MAKNSIFSFGLVSIEVSIDNAVKSLAKDANFESASPNGNPVEQVYIEKGSDGEETYGRTDLLKGKFVGEEFREIPTEKQDEIKEVTKLDNIELNFMPMKDVDVSNATGKHFVKAKTGYENKLRLLIDGMKKSKTAFAAKWMPVSRQALIVGIVENDGLVLLQVPYMAQRKEAPEVTGNKPSAKELGMAVKLIEASTNPEFVNEATDEGLAMKTEAIQAVVDGKPVKKSKKSKTVAKDKSLEELLEASLA